MALLLVMCNDAPGRYDAGDVVAVLPDGTQLGRMEDIDAWEAWGGDPAEFPATFYVVDLEGLTVEDARQFLDGDDTRRRVWNLNTTALERRQGGARETLRTRFKIRRRWADVSAHMKRKA